jgi:AraC-like DNA-binding protein
MSKLTMLHLQDIESEVHSAAILVDAKLIYSSHELPSRDRIPIWNEVVWRNYVPLQIKITPHDDFAGQVALTQLGGVRVVTSGSRAQCITRTPKLIAQDSEEYLMLGLQLKGAAIIDQHERQAQLRSGDFVFWDTRKPYTINFPSDWEMAVFQFPRSALTFSPKSIDSFTALTFHGQKGVAQIASRLLMGIAEEARYQTFEHDTPLLEHTLGILDFCIGHKLTDCELTPNYNEVLLRRINSYIGENLQNPQLSAIEIAQAHGLSLSQLYRVFQSQRSTVGDQIRQRRLDRIKYELTTPASRHFTIAALARKWGFLDTPHFNRVFKAQYKITPQQLQHQAMSNRKTQIDK